MGPQKKKKVVKALVVKGISKFYIEMTKVISGE